MMPQLRRTSRDGAWYVVRGAGDFGPRATHHAPKYLPGSHLRCSRISWGMTKADTQEWLHHWQDEADAAYLYLALAGQESDPHRKDVYIKLAGVEERHVQMWSKLLGEHGHKVDHARPSLNAKLRAWFGRRFGTRYLLPMLLREEGEEVKGYLNLHKESNLPDAQEVSLQLAKESAAHAGTLAELAGKGAEPWHKTGSGGFLRNVVYGFNDGLTANFGLVAGVIGAAVQPHVIMISGVAGMIADALSMGSSGYLAAKSEQEVWEHEIAMEKEEIRLMPEVEQEEMALQYEAKGVDPRTARRMAEEVMRDPERALGEQVRDELKIGEAHATPFREGWITGVATAIGAFIPVFPFLVFEGRVAIWVAFVTAMLSHFAVGAARSFFTGRSVFRSGIDMFVVGLGVAAVGFLVGDLVAKVL